MNWPLMIFCLVCVLFVAWGCGTALGRLDGMQRMTKFKWTGSNCVEVSDFLGHEDFWHKAGVLLINTSLGQVRVNKGQCIEKLPDGSLNVVDA